MPKPNQTTIVYQDLKEKIDQGYYSPAENLPEVELSTEYNVSRNTIKKALLMLEKDAYVTIQQNKGAKVRSYSKTEVLEFMELREMLEGFIIRLAVPCFTEPTIREMEEILEQMTRCREQGDLFGYSANNQAFHNVIYQVCPNRTAVDVTLRLKGQMKKYNSKTVLIPGRCDRSYQEHQAIFDAVRQGDAMLAEKNMREHIRNVRDVYDAYYAFLF